MGGNVSGLSTEHVEVEEGNGNAKVHAVVPEPDVPVDMTANDHKRREASHFDRGEEEEM